MTRPKSVSESNTLKKRYFDEVITSGGKLEKSNPFISDKSFLYALLSYYEASQEYDKCVMLLDKIFEIK